ncbi:hypothetical protein OHS70_34370 [Streptomyces sp. NBC_00390]|uniref:hypothetical protein n=1 Tax=Streptomyces sp. NBC_00390 TaxID=2975736 RepID=UPI002E2260AC
MDRPEDPCGRRDRAVCDAARRLARALLGRLTLAAREVDPRVRTLTLTYAEKPNFQLWHMHDRDGLRIHDFAEIGVWPGPQWNAVLRDANQLAKLADIYRHPAGFYYVHPLPDERDRAIILPANPRGSVPRTAGELQ